MTACAHVSVHTIDLAIDPAAATQTMAQLSEPEQARARRFVHARDRCRFVAAHAGLRRVLGRALDLAPADVAIRDAVHHKPVLRDPHALHFNLSHAGDVALAALSAHGPLGVDVEPVRDLSDMALVAQRVFCPAERAAWGQQPESLRATSFFLGWTRKEAVIKATGEGFRADLQALCVSLVPGGEPAVLAAPAVAAPPWQLAHLEPRPGYVGAVAMRSDLPLKVTCLAAEEGG